MPRHAPLALGLAWLVACVAPERAAAIPLSLDDPTPRPVSVRFELGSADRAEDLRSPHEAFGPALRGRLEPDGDLLVVTLDGALLETALGGLALPGTASDALFRFDPATGAVLEAAYSFETPVFFGVDGPHLLTVDTDSLGAGGFLPSFRFCAGPPRCTLVAAEPYDPATGRFLAIGTAASGDLGATFWSTDVELAEVPEPGAAAMFAGGLAALGARRRRPVRRTSHRAPSLGLRAAAGLAILACDGPSVRITAPAPDTVVLGPSLTVELALDPPLGAGETLTASLEAGLDRPVGSQHRDVTGDLTIAAGAAAAALPLADLPQGRSRVRVERRNGGALVSADERTVDRGGFSGATGERFGAGVRYELVVRATDGGGQRGIDVAVWYPIADPAPTLALPIERDLLAALDAPPHPGAVALPALVYSHGNCGWEGQSSFLTADLARSGFVVVAPAHPGNTVIDPDCDAGIGTAILERPGDLAAVLDALLDWNADSAWPLAGAIDAERIGGIGFSLGSFSTAQRAAQDPRLRAALLLAAPFPAVLFVPLDIPVLIEGGRLDTTLPFDSNAVPLYQALTPPRFLAGIDAAGHGSFSTECHTPFTDCAPGTQSLAELHALMLRYARGFLGRWLAGDVRYESLLMPVPGATFDAEP